MFQRHHFEILIQTSATPPTTVPSSQNHVTSYIFNIATWREADARQIELTNCVVDFITSSLQPLSRVDDPAFRSMIHKAQPAFTMPSRKYLSTKLLPEKTAQLHSRISDRLKNVHSICLTVDIWSSRGMRAYIGITAHYILDYKLQSVMLACKRCKGSHTAENILVTY